MEGTFYSVVLETYITDADTRMVKTLDEVVEAFRNRPLNSGPYTYLWLDAHVQKCREAGRVVNVACVTAIGVNADGTREVLGMDVFTSEDGSGWTAFLRGLCARGLSGVKLAISDAHPGLKDAIASTLPGATWQRCRAHFMRNLLSRVPKAAGDLVATLVRSIFAQPDRKSVYEQHAMIVEQLEDKFPDVACMLDEAKDEILAFATFPKKHWKQIWSNNPLERLNKEIRRRTDVVGIFPNRSSVVRLVGAVLAEQNDEWQVGRRYMSQESIAKACLTVIDGGKVTKTKMNRKVKEEVLPAVL